MDFVSHRGITLILIGRFVIQLTCICVFDVYLFVPFQVSSLVVQLKLKCLLKRPSHDDSIEAKAFYIQLSFERYKGKFKCCVFNKAVSKISKSVSLQHLGDELHSQ